MTACKRMNTSIYPRLPVHLIEPKIQFLQLACLVFSGAILVSGAFNILLLLLLVGAAIIPFISQFLVPASPVLLYLLMRTYARSALPAFMQTWITPLPPSLLDGLESDITPIVLHISTAIFLWIYRPNISLKAYGSRIGILNVAVLLANLIPGFHKIPYRSVLALMDTVNVFLVALTLWHNFFANSSFPTPWTLIFFLLGTSFLLAKHPGEIIAISFGGLIMATSYFYGLIDAIDPDIQQVLLPEERIAQEEIVEADIPQVVSLEQHISDEAAEADIQQALPSNQVAMRRETTEESGTSLLSTHHRAHSRSRRDLPTPPGSNAPTPTPAENLSDMPVDPEKFDNSSFTEWVPLGNSSTRALHRVWHPLTKKFYAVKSITPREMNVEQLRGELLRLRAVDHVNNVRCFGIYGGDSERGEADLKVVLEHHGGGSIKSIGTRLKNMGATIDEHIVQIITKGILEGLAYLHDIPIIHRDIKPTNILFSGDGVVKLSEFVPAGESVNRFGDTFMSVMPYTAPERMSAKPYTDRADIWSMGITLLELCTNTPPYSETLDAVGLMLVITDDSPPPQLNTTGGWSGEMGDFFTQILVKNPDRRPSARALLGHSWVPKIGVQEEMKMRLWIRRNQMDWNGPRPPRRHGTLEFAVPSAQL